MGSELHAGSLAMHWFLVLNFKTFPKYTSMNLSWYFPGTLMDLGIQIPQKINLLSRVLLQTLSFPHVLRAELSLSDPGQCPQPTGGASPPSSQGSRAHSICISGTYIAQEQSHGEGDKHKVRMRDAWKDIKQKLGWSPFLWQRCSRRGNDWLRSQATLLTASLGRFDLTT